MIKQYRHKGKIYKLVDSTISTKNNVFSILVGRNGSGKSTLLGNLTNRLAIEAQEKKDYHSKYQQSIFGDVNFFPKEIIAVSTSPFDKFPIIRESKKIDCYTYLGLRDLSGKNLGLAYMSKIIISLLQSVVRDSIQSKEIIKVLKYLGYKDEIWVEFHAVYTRSLIYQIISVENPMMIFQPENKNLSKRLNQSFFLKDDGAIDEDRVHKLKEILLKLNNNGSLYLKMSFCINKNGLSGNVDYFDDILFLIQSNIMRLKDVNLKRLTDDLSFSINNASSGEQSIILSILGIASKIKNNCLICIDEPEICLHPEWQKKYIEILISTFSNYNNCHFIIATHSPQIISKLNEDSFIVDMESGELKNASEYINHSADFQLANIFNSPGFKNEYLSRIALNVFTKVSKRKVFDLDDLNKLELLRKQSVYLEEGDPVFNLFEVIQEMHKLYG